MSEHHFGLGKGHVSEAEAERVGAIAKEAGATFTTYSEPSCACGYGCRPFNCRNATRFWFSVRNYGEPHNGRVAREVLAKVGKIKVR